MEADIIPLPSEETTPPVTKMYLDMVYNDCLSMLSYHSVYACLQSFSPPGVG